MEVGPMSDSLWRRLTAGTWRIRQGSDWEEFVGPNWLNRIMTVQVTDDFHAKQGRSTGRWLLEANGQRLSVYLKRHYRLSWWRGILATLWPNPGWSPALKEWRNLRWARNQGLAVPTPVAAGEFIGPWGQLQSFLAVEELTGMLPLHLAIPAARHRLDQAVFQCWKRTLVVELARLIRELHQRRRFHRDLYLCHFYIPTEDTMGIPSWPGRVHLIDLHRMAHRPWAWGWWRIKDLAQILYASDVIGVNDRDRLRFWRFYLGASWKSHRFLRLCILFKCRRYKRHNDKKRTRRLGRVFEAHQPVVEGRFSVGLEDSAHPTKSGR
jgi:heptose I phosphotransferase